MLPEQSYEIKATISTVLTKVIEKGCKSGRNFLVSLFSMGQPHFKRFHALKNKTSMVMS